MDGAAIKDYLDLLSGPPPPLPAGGDPVAFATSAVPHVNQTLVFPLLDGGRAFAKRNEPRHAMLCASEWAASCVGLLAGFDLLPIAQLFWDGDLYVAWPYLGPNEVTAGVMDAQRPEFRRARNADAVPYEIAVLDALVANPDRHDGGNVIVVTGRTDLNATHETAFLIDHDRSCFFVSSQGGMARLDHLTRDWIDDWLAQTTAWLRADASWRHRVTDRSALYAQVTVMQHLLDDRLIDGLAGMIPSDWCDAAARGALVAFLRARRDHLEEIVTARLGEFPNLVIAP